MMTVTSGSVPKYNKAELQEIFYNAVHTALVEIGDDWRNVEWISSLPYILQESADNKKAA